MITTSKQSPFPLTDAQFLPLSFLPDPNMRLSPRLFANPTAANSTTGLKPAPLALLPPIPLYRRILRTHRKHLPNKMRLLGDEYVKSEFRAHRDTENPVHIVRDHILPERASAVNASDCERLFRRKWCLDHGALVNGSCCMEQIGFLTEWQMYAQKIEGDRWLGERLDDGVIQKMSGTCRL